MRISSPFQFTTRPALQACCLAALGACLPGRLPAPTIDTTPYYINCTDTIATSNPDWMGWISDDVPIWALSLPGTHDTMTYNYDSIDNKFVKDQTLSLETQLAAGIRLIDIRVRHIEDRFLCRHGNKYLGLNFSDVLWKVNTFLDSHPTETVLMNIQREKNPFDDNEPLDTDCTRTFEQTFLYYRDNSGLGGRIWRGPFTDWPKLGTVRGKIIPCVLYGASGIISDDIAIKFKTSGPYFEAPNDDGHAYDLTNNRSVNEADADDPANTETSFWEKKRRSLVAARCHANDSLSYPVTWRQTGLNGYTTRPGLGSALPFMVAGGIGDGCTDMCVCDLDVYSNFTGMNEHALTFLKAAGSPDDFLSCGAVLMDYPGWKLINSIIARNPVVFVTPSEKPGGFPPPTTDGFGNSKSPFWNATNAIGKAMAAIQGANQCSVTPAFTLRVEAGSYPQNVSFNKPLRLLPVGGAVRIGTQ